MIDSEAPGWARTAYWLMAATYAAGFLLLVLLFVVGVFLGPGAPADPPAVDFDDEPTAVVADATARLEHRDFVTTYRWQQRNLTTGNRSDVRYVRATFENSADRLLVRLWPSAFSDGRPDPSDAPRRAFVTRYGPAWVSPAHESGWHRAREFAGYDRAPVDRFDRYDVGDGNATVRRNNETHYVAVGRPPANLAEREFEAFRITAVIAKQPEPHLVSYTEIRAYPQSVNRDVVRVSQYGNASAPRPPRIPSTTIEELLGRAAAGLDRLF